MRGNKCAEYQGVSKSTLFLTFYYYDVKLIKNRLYLGQITI